jgi:hypothetical protein
MCHPDHPTNSPATATPLRAGPAYPESCPECPTTLTNLPPNAACRARAGMRAVARCIAAIYRATNRPCVLYFSQLAMPSDSASSAGSPCRSLSVSEPSTPRSSGSDSDSGSEAGAGSGARRRATTSAAQPAHSGAHATAAVLRLLFACKVLPRTLAALFRAVLLRRPHGIGGPRGQPCNRAGRLCSTSSPRRMWQARCDMVNPGRVLDGNNSGGVQTWARARRRRPRSRAA